MTPTTTPNTLIPCTDCATMISSRAVSCPKCGSPVTQDEPLDRSTFDRKYVERLNMRAMAALILVVFLTWVYLVAPNLPH